MVQKHVMIRATQEEYKTNLYNFNYRKEYKVVYMTCYTTRYYEAGVYGGLVLTKLRLAEFPRPFSIWLITYLIRLEAGHYSPGLVLATRSDGPLPFDTYTTRKNTT
jgi:hypothetical protein